MFLFHLPLKYNAELKKINSRNQKKIKIPEIVRSIKLLHRRGSRTFAGKRFHRLTFFILQSILFFQAKNYRIWFP